MEVWFDRWGGGGVVREKDRARVVGSGTCIHIIVYRNGNVPSSV